MTMQRVGLAGLAFSFVACLTLANAGWVSPAQAQNDSGALRALQGSPNAPPSAGAPSAPAQNTIGGEWSGKYFCGQGVTGAQLLLSDDGSRALFHFFAVPENPGVPEGCFTLSGSYDAASRTLNLNAGRWIVRPRRYVGANVSGLFDAGGQNFLGRVLGPAGCTVIALTRGPSARPLPAACAGAVP